MVNVFDLISTGSILPTSPVPSIKINRFDVALLPPLRLEIHLDIDFRWNIL